MMWGEFVTGEKKHYIEGKGAGNDQESRDQTNRLKRD
jgi:hypothetical protein